MVPEEWPIAATAADRSVEPARSAGRDRLSTVRRDFFLDPAQRLTEQERALMTAMLHGLVTEIADEIWAALDLAAANDDSGPALIRALGSARLLDLPPLVALLLRRAEQEQIASAFRSRGGRRDGRHLQAQVSDEDATVSAAAMALILARGRRQDRFGQARLHFDDVPGAVVGQLVNAVAAAIAVEAGVPLDQRVVEAARLLIDRHDEKRSLDWLSCELVHALHLVGRLTDDWLHAAAGEGDSALLGHALAERAGVPWDHAVDALLSGDGQRLITLLRVAGVSRDCAAGLLASLSDGLGIRDPAGELARYDQLGPEQVARARAWMKLPDPYRDALEALGKADGQRAV